MTARPAGPEPPGDDPARAALARRQAELLAALVADGDPPAGFDRDRLAVEAAALRAKRIRVLTRLLDPAVVDALGPDLRRHLDRWVRAHPRPTGTGFHDDARAVTAALRAEGLLPRRRWWSRRP